MTTLGAMIVRWSTSGHICFYADGTDYRPRHCERLMKLLQQMLGGRSRRSSGFAGAAAPEARRLDKLAWSRRCAMLMGSACPWKLEHICVTFYSSQGVLTIITEPLDRQSDRPCAYHCPGCKTGRRKFGCHDFAAASLSQSVAPAN